MSDAIKVTDAQKQEVNALVTKKGDITVVIPETMSAADIHSKLMSFFAVKEEMEAIVNRKLKPVIGRLLVLASNLPEIWSTRGYDSFEQYLQKEVCDRFGIARSNALEGKRIMEKFPSLAMETYREIGVTKLALAARFTSQEETGHKKILEAAAKAGTVEEFRSHCVKKGYIAAGETTGDALRITGTKKDIREIRGFLDRADVQACVGSESWSKVILAMTQECDAEWTQKGAKALKDAERAEAKDAA